MPIPSPVTYTFPGELSSTLVIHTIPSELLTDKKENIIFLIYKEPQSGEVAKSYMKKGFLIHEEMRKYFPIYEEAVSHIRLCNCFTLNILIYEENLIFFFISVSGFHPLGLLPILVSSFFPNALFY